MPAASPSAELSPLDRRILRVLQRDGRISNAELAREVGISPAACWTHTKRLFETGVIRGVHALVDPEAVGRGTLALVGVVLDRSTPESFAAFEAAVRAMEQVLECVLVAGEVDYFLRIRVRDLPAFNRLHSERIIALPGVRQVRTFFVMNEIKMDGLLPI
jgi:Lrp/AsnC family leucine-responsive transcriptional regulator